MMKQAPLLLFLLSITALLGSYKAQKDTGAASKASHLQTLKEDFKNLDKNDDGYIDPHELRIAVPGISEDDVTFFFDQYDGDRNGVITLEEYMMILNNQDEGENTESSAQ